MREWTQLYLIYLILIAIQNTATAEAPLRNEDLKYILEKLALMTKDNTHHKKNKDDIQRKYKILSFGDSLTEGYYGVKHIHPYTIMLKKLLARNYGDHFNVTNAGIGGERVHVEMYPRLKDILHDSTYDLVLILGGVNDLATLDCVTKVDLYSDILKLHNLAHEKGIKTVVMTIMEAHIAPKKLNVMSKVQFQLVRRRVNRKLRRISSELSILCDTAVEFPLDSLPLVDRKYLWSKDFVHPTPNGFDELGRVIFECLSSKLDLPS